MSSKPTILLITADEMNRAALSCYGATSHRTPNLDRLAAQGVLFRSAYTSSPVCLPARCSLMTGLYPHQNRCVSNGTGASLSLHEPNLFTLLNAAGYRTSKHGKCHFIPVTYAYNAREFTREYEHFIHYYRALGMEHLDLMDDPQVSAWYYDDYAKDLERHGLLREFRRCVWECRERSEEFPVTSTFRFPGPDHLHPDSWVGERTLDRIRGLSADEPAFLWASFGGPHYPACPPEKYYAAVDMDRDRPRPLRAGEWDDASKFNAKDGAGGYADGDLYAPDRWQGHFDEPYWRGWRHAYYASCVQIDDYVGRIVAAAEEKWGDNLLVIFLADHGDMMGDHGFWGKCLHDQGTRVPFIARFPGQRHAGTTSDVLAQTVDILPTCLAAAGAAPHACAGQPLEQLMASNDRRFAITEYEGLLMVTDARVKSIRRLRDGKEFLEVRDLVHDPDEFENAWPRRESIEGYAAVAAEVERLQADPEVRQRLFYSGEDTPYWARL